MSEANPSPTGFNMTPTSDLEWYCRKKTPEEERYLELFFLFVRYYDINLAYATEEEQRFIHARITECMEHDKDASGQPAPIEQTAREKVAADRQMPDGMSVDERYRMLVSQYQEQYRMNWDAASDREKAFVLERARLRAEREEAERQGLDPNEIVRDFFGAPSRRHIRFLEDTDVSGL